MACFFFDCDPNDKLQIISEVILFLLAGLFILLNGPKILTYILSRLIRPCKSNPLKVRDNDFAIITGASDGIGLEYAEQLAAKGYNLFLLSRTLSKLEAVKADIQEKYSNDVHVMSVDFTDTNIYPAIRERIKTLPGRVAVLINNVGIMNPSPEEFPGENDNPESYVQMINCNVVSVVKMCEIILPIMKKQKFGIVTNISSSMGQLPFPYFAVYSSTKCFVANFTRAVSIEYGNYGIVFQDLYPGQVTTNLTKEVRNKLFSVSAPSYVKYALNAIGKEFHTNAHPKHKFINNLSIFFNYWLPEFMADPMLKSSMKNLDNRKKDSAKVHP